MFSIINSHFLKYKITLKKLYIKNKNNKAYETKVNFNYDKNI